MKRSFSLGAESPSRAARKLNKALYGVLDNVKRRLSFSSRDETSQACAGFGDLSLAVDEDRKANRKSAASSFSNISAKASSVGCECALERDLVESGRGWTGSTRIMPDSAIAGQLHDVASEIDGKLSFTASGRSKYPDWANVPPDFLERLAHHLKDSCAEEDWKSLQTVFAAASVCRRWRDAVTRVCFERSYEGSNTRKRFGKSLSDRMLCHPSQLLERFATEEETIRCYIVREKHRGPLGASTKRYKLVLGADYSKPGKTLLVAEHQLFATKSAYNVYLNDADCSASRRKLGQLVSSPYGTVFDIYSTPDLKSGSIRRTSSGTVKYTFKMLGGRGPRSVQVNMASEETSNERDLRYGYSKSKDKIHDSNDGRRDDIVSHALDNDEFEFENKLPRWHDLLQCWCLDFGGRVKCASVKNFQLVTKNSPEEIILQFGKVDSNVFTMDFQPSFLSAQRAFMISLSSFDAKLSCF